MFFPFSSGLVKVLHILQQPCAPTHNGDSEATQSPKPAREARADDGVRTRDPQLGKLMLYQLSYVRVPLNDSDIVER
jgi:hypothetical protein